MSKWKTDDMIMLLQSLGCKIKKSDQDGGYDTTNILLIAKGAKGSRLYVKGFVENGKPEVTNPDDCDVDYIELTDGEDSAGGLNTADDATCILYGEVCALLRKKGFNVVAAMDDYYG